jgi:hypothetical protein
MPTRCPREIEFKGGPCSQPNLPLPLGEPRPNLPLPLGEGRGEGLDQRNRGAEGVVPSPHPNPLPQGEGIKIGRRSVGAAARVGGGVMVKREAGGGKPRPYEIRPRPAGRPECACS